MTIFIILCTSHNDATMTVHYDACHRDIVSYLDDVDDVAPFYQLLFWVYVCMRVYQSGNFFFFFLSFHVYILFNFTRITL